MRIIAFIALVAVPALGQERDVTSRVTFIAGLSVYAAFGRSSGLTDSCRGVVMNDRDTVAHLRAVALSSHSSSWRVERSTRNVIVGDTIHVRLAIADIATAAQPDTTPSGFTSGGRTPKRRMAAERPAVDVRGRLSFYYFGVRTNELQSSSAQPGIALNLRAAARDLPLQITFYGTHRQIIRNGLSPFAPGSGPENRLYRFSVEYDDSTTIAAVGRLFPIASPTISAVDGISVARRFGGLTAGISGGVEPSLNLGRDPTGVKKGILFAAYSTMDPFYLNSAVAYARSYQHGSLIREVASVTGSMYMPSGIGINLLSDVDLRRPMQIRAATDPGISSVMLLGTARVLPMLTVSAGYDAARPIPSATMIGVVPDSLFDRTLRSGLSGGVTVSIQSWTWTLNYSPRTSPTRFGEEYSAMTSVGTYDLLGLGVDVRANGTRNMNSMTQYSTYGLQAHKQLWGVDWRVRGQLNDLLIRQANSSHTSAQGGMDLVVQLAQSLSLSASLDLIRGGGLDMDLLYIECSWRF